MDNLAYDEYIEEQRCEIIGGKTVMLARPAIPHGEVVSNIHNIFKNYLKGKHCRVYIEPDLFLSETDNLIPDLAIVCDRGIIKYGGIYGTPDLVVEVLSPRTAKYDRSVKKDIYERVGVKEYWLVSPVEKSIEVYYLREEKFILDNIYHVYTADEWSVLTEKEKNQETLKLKVSLYDDLIVDVREVFEDMMEWG